MTERNAQHKPGVASRFFAKRIPVILQDEIAECGLASIAMVASYYGRETTLRQMRQDYSVALGGISLYQIIKVSETLGLATRPLKLTLDYIKELKTPSILFWNNMHFVVLESVTSKGINVVDPAVGRRFYSWEAALPLFSNFALEVVPGLGFQRSQEGKGSSRLSFTGILKNNAWLYRYLIPMALLAVVINLGAIAAPKLFSLTIDQVVAKNDPDFLYLILYIFSGLFFFKTIATWLRTALNARLRVALTQDLSTGVIAWLLRLPVPFFERRSPVDILRRTQAVDQAYIQFTAGRIDMAIDSIFAVVFLVLMGLINLKLAGLSLALCLAFCVFRLVMLPIIEKKHQVSIEAETARNAVLFDVLGAVQSMKLYGYEASKLALWSNRQAETEIARADVSRMQEMNTVVHTGLSHSQSLLVSGLGALAVLKGVNSIGDLFAFVLYKDLFMDSVLKAVDRYMSLRLIKVDLDRAEHIIDEAPEEVGVNVYASSALANREQIRHLEIQAGVFRYGSFERPVLKSLQLQVNRLQKVAIYGSSGFGKSTLLKVLAGFYALESGELKVNGMPIANFGLRRYRQSTAYVTATDEIIDGTVIDNILMDADHVDGEHLQACVEQVGLVDSILQLGSGFNTLLGTAGVQLSSGQKQRLLIARALYRKPDVLLLDEPTSHLDHESRDVVINSLRTLPMLCVIVTHDPVMLQACDVGYQMIDGALQRL
ncbi:ATP-binding cassette subfamily B protein RaxB [Pseudomonas fluorescens]|uniref:peptidase domain-containing ABC transporter n=1 Tax=Pseudomonas fluorescens TaxID=294 RepID=UPI00209D770D|nr:peptidase domain-containing ABC transporter [Pseudomonas fluorescens]MCP1489951.1 ATP-binding cassette subfamily B protein RaxB [Pseudomonas fluorescens]MCP1489967.1 ATP-binding cassette subfamily B protein RaxB [Pseudomonas fluorescens]